MLNLTLITNIYTECPVTFGTLSKHYFSAPNKDIKIPKDIVCRGSFAILSNVLQAKLKEREEVEKSPRKWENPLLKKKCKVGYYAHFFTDFQILN